MPETPTTQEKVAAEGGAKGNIQERERSTIVFPYLALAVEIVRAVHETGGQQSQMDIVAAHLNEAANGGGFRTKIVTAKIFGLVKYTTGIISLTQLGSRITDPDQEKAARAEAFLHVPLYRRVYDDFKGLVLPSTPAALEAMMVALGVSPKQKDKARQVFQRSAQQAGFFAYGNNKLISPTMSSTNSAITKAKTEDIDSGNSQEDKARGGGNAGSGGGGQYHPFIQGLLQTLPEPNTEWQLNARKKWLQSALSIFDVIYKSQDDEQTLTVRLEKPTAN
jgi:hypothetical protein